MFRVHLKKCRIVVFILLCLLLSVFVLIHLNYTSKKKVVEKSFTDIPKFFKQAALIDKQQFNNGLAINTTSKLLNSHLLQRIMTYNKALHGNGWNVSYNVHAFYYAWYGNPQFDGRYLHWNHRFLPHWEDRVSKSFATGSRHEPPDDIGSNYYPLLGTYSSVDPEVLSKHMEYFTKAGIGVLSLSWYPPNKSDEEGKPLDYFVPTILNVAEQYGIKVCFHIEPYTGRNASSVVEDIKYIIKKYGSYKAFYKTYKKHGGNKQLPLFYIYDSYLTPSVEWKEVLSKQYTNTTIRGTSYDAIVIGLLVESKHKTEIATSGFDGFYTYFASSGFSFGSKHSNWKSLSSFAKDNNLIFIPSVGPGYIDTNIRPWNGKNTKLRLEGSYYDNSWQNALQCQPQFVSITSFNEWGEGTQIEPAIRKTSQVKHVLGSFHSGTFTYESYASDPDMYIRLTSKWVNKFESFG